MSLNIPKIKKPNARLSVRRLINKLKIGYRNILMKQQGSGGGVGGNVLLMAGDKNLQIIGALGEERKEKEKRIRRGKFDLALPARPIALESPLSTEEKEMLRSINLKYPLIPSHPKRGEKVYAYAHIFWSDKYNDIVYNVVEPFITKADIENIENIKRMLEERLDVDFIKIGEVRAKEILRKELSDILNEMGGVGFEKRDVYIYYIERDILGMGKIEPLMRDPDIEDISCDGERIPIYVYHRNPMLGSIITNVIFEDKDELDTFVMKLAQKCGKSVSVAEPLMDGSLPDGSRVQATLGTDIAMKGSNFTIRKFTSSPLTPVHMIEYGTASSLQMAYLWLAIENRKSILISGGTATGKTSFLNALSLFIKPSLKVVSIEDTPELRLPHPHWVPEVARSAISEEGNVIGDVNLFDLLKSSLRQRPDYIIVGEVRGKETYVLFQQIATGHAGLATLHAASLPQLIDRLTTPPISLPPTLIENLDIIVFLTNTKIRDKYVRRVNEILEIIGIEDGRPATEVIFKWNPTTDKFEIKGKSRVMDDIIALMGISEAEMKEEIMVRKEILEWMVENRIYDYRQVANIINTYYSNPDKILNMIE